MASLAKKRKMNFCEREVEIIIEEIERHKHVLLNHFNAGVTHLAKNGAWMDILRKVNAVTTCPRELAEVKKKWSDMKTEVRRKVAQARAAIEGVVGAPPVPVILSATQQRICNLLGEATIVTLPPGDQEEEQQQHDAVLEGLPITTVTITETLPTETVCDEVKQLNETYMEEGGVVEYCTTTVTDPASSVEATPTVDMLGGSPPPLAPSQRPQELKSRIALNSARLLQEQRVTNVHVRQISQHLEAQNQLLAAMRRSQEAQAYAQERQAVALEGTQAALLALVQMLRPATKELRRFLQSGEANASAAANASVNAGFLQSGEANANATANASVNAGFLQSGEATSANANANAIANASASGGSVPTLALAPGGTEDTTRAKTPPPDTPLPQPEEEEEPQ